MTQFQVHPHTLNQDFTWSDHRTDALRLLTPEQLRQFDRDGFCVLEDAIDRQTLDSLLKAIDPIEAGIDKTELTLSDGSLYRYSPKAITFTCNLVARSTVVRRFLTSRLFQDLGHDLIGPDVRLYWDQAVYKKPEIARNFPWHQDNGYTFTEPQTYVTCWIALTDATIDNGCPWIIPGLHRRGTLHHVPTDDGIEIDGLAGVQGEPTPLAAGSMVVFSSLTPHRTGPNITGTYRKALIAQYMADGAQLLLPDGASQPLNDPLTNPLILQGDQPVSPDMPAAEPIK